MKPTTIIKFIPWVIIILLGITIWIILPKKVEEKPKENINHHMVIDKIESIGKLELTKYYIKDVIEHEEMKEWYLPNAKVVLIISGEVTGCIDLTKIDSSAITIEDSTMIIQLPEPEICNFKVNHQFSKVYDIENEYFNKSELIDKAYRLAETKLREAAITMNILGQTKSTAITTLQPIFEQIADKKIKIQFAPTQQ